MWESFGSGLVYRLSSEISPTQAVCVPSPIDSPPTRASVFVFIPKSLSIVIAA